MAMSANLDLTLRDLMVGRALEEPRRCLVRPASRTNAHLFVSLTLERKSTCGQLIKQGQCAPNSARQLLRLLVVSDHTREHEPMMRAMRVRTATAPRRLLSARGHGMQTRVVQSRATWVEASAEDRLRFSPLSRMNAMMLAPKTSTAVMSIISPKAWE